MRPHLFQLVKFFYKPYVLLVINISICGILLVLFEGFKVATAFPVITSVIGSKSVETGSAFITIIQKVISIIPIKDKLIAIFVLFFVNNILANIFQYFYETLTQISSYVIMRDFQKRIYKKVIQSDYQYFLDNKQGDLMYRAITAPGQMIRMFLVFPKFIIEFLKFLFIITILFTLSINTTTWILFIGIILYFVVKWLSKKVSYNTGKGRVRASQEQNILSSESFSGIRQIKVFSATERWINEFFKSSDNFAKFAVKDSLFLFMPSSLLGIVTISIICIGSIIMKMRMGDSFVSFLPVTGVYLYALMQIVPSMASFGQMHMQFMGGLPYAEVVYKELHSESHKINDGSRTLTVFNKGICFDDVSFTYPGRNSTLKNINVTFEKGKVTAIVGPSGSGKSTIIDLILRLYVPTSGKILIGGHNLSDLKISSWLEKVGFVSQDTFIFNATIADNISFRFNGDNSEGIINAAKVANAHDFISALPEGYNTIVGDRGLKLSGGQRQRVAIARAVFKKPEILIFDEATSFLDSAAEKEVEAAINILLTGHTVIVVAHRLSTVINADVIFVVDEGRVVEQGSHNTLIGKGGLYRRLYNKQFSFTGV